ncbi:MAG: toprim domain-containing protein [Candidatus Paceibacterota bacterium]
MDSLRRLEEIFAHFPGIGPRQAKRFVYHLLAKSPASIKEFTQLVEEVKRSTAQCSSCHRFFMGMNAKASDCSVCSDTSRDQSTLMVVARDSDFESIEKSGAYKGLYFILGGTVPILDKEPEKRIRLKPLLERAGKKDSGLNEIILSLNATPDGENTAEIVRDALIKLKGSFKVSILGRGLSTGSELEYTDGDTIKSALQNRH